jgi:hypothetical protein
VNEPLFEWETLQEAGRLDLQYQGKTVPGKVYDIQLTSGPVVRVWRSEDCQQYFCHGLTFGGKQAPGGPVSPFTGKSVETLLEWHYDIIAEEQARPGDILVWRGPTPETTPHSAVLTDARLDPRQSYLDETATRLQTKNGLSPEANLSLGQLISIYGESYNVYRKR